MRIYFLTFMISIPFIGFSQQRISLDASTRLQNLNLTFTYHRVIKKQFLVSVGIFSGSNGRAFSGFDTLQFDNGKYNQSPFSRINNSITDSARTYNLLSYETIGKSVGVAIGLGYFIPLGENHSLRANLNAKFGQAYANIHAYYRLNPAHRGLLRNYTIAHPIQSISAELYHGIRLSDRFACYYGVKIPYYYKLNQAKFNPLNLKDLYYSFEPELSIGLSYYIGKMKTNEEGQNQ